MSTRVEKRRASYDDVLAAPENMVAEILDGELYLSPRPASPHAFATTKMIAALDVPFASGPRLPDRTGGWWLLVEPELHLHDEVVVPDIAGWRRDRMPVVPDTTAIELTPDWVCESLSPSTVRLDRKKKVITYAREKLPHLWFVDARAQTLEPYELTEAGTSPARSGSATTRPVFRRSTPSS